jgi:molybdate transport system regulatory protein
MNHLPGRIVGIENADGITLVDVESAGIALSALMLGPLDPAQPLTVGAPVQLLFKEAEVSLARGLSGSISLRNRLPCTVTALQQGRLLTRVGLEFAGYPLESIITTGSAQRLELAPGVQVEALVKANEMSLG